MRTRAGPAVEAKAREIRETIAETRRHRAPIGSLYSAGSYEDRSPAPVTSTYTHSSVPDAPASLNGNHDALPPMTSLSFTDRNKLTDIAEGVASHDFATPYDPEYRRDSTSTLCEPGSTTSQPSPPCSYGQVQIVTDAYTQLYQVQALPPHMQLQMPPTATQHGRLFQSCPASIHTTPVPSRLTLERAGWGMFSNPFAQQDHNNGARSIHEETSVTHRIAAPAASPPFTPKQDLQISQYPLSPASGAHSHVVSWANTPVNGPPQIIAHSFEQSHFQNSVSSNTQTPQQLQDASWENRATPLSPPPPGTIDPRWISPLSSLWSTPAATPRTGSPIQLMGTSMPASYAPPASQPFDLSLVQYARGFGTQSYPPGSSERRHAESPPVPIFDHNGHQVNRCAEYQAEPHKKEDDGHPEMSSRSTAPFHTMTGGIGGGRWFQ